MFEFDGVIDVRQAVRELLRTWEEAAGYTPTSPDISIDEAVQHALHVIFRKGNLPPNGNPAAVFAPLVAAVIYLSRPAVRAHFIVMSERRFITKLNIGATAEDIWTDIYLAVLDRLADPNRDLKPIADLERFVFGAALKLFRDLVERAKAEIRLQLALRERTPVRRDDWWLRVVFHEEMLAFIHAKRRQNPGATQALRGFARVVQTIIDNPDFSHGDCIRLVLAQPGESELVVPASTTFSRWFERFIDQVRSPQSEIV